LQNILLSLLRQPDLATFRNHGTEQSMHWNAGGNLPCILNAANEVADFGFSQRPDSELLK
jgi:hypothetical protein